jgi:hypothetical protein
VWTNELGCFDTPYRGEEPYIYITGDSYTWGWAPFERKWGKEIERLLGLRTLTCGSTSFGTRHELIKTARDLDRLPTPQLIIVGYFGTNDASDDSVFPQFTVYDGRRVPAGHVCGPLSEPCTIPTPQSPTLGERLRFFFERNSVLYSMYAQWGEKKSGQSLIPEESEGYARHLEAIAGFKRLADAHNTHLLFVLIPEKIEQPGGNAQNERIKKYLDAQNIRYIDLAPYFHEARSSSGPPLYWDFDMHWSAAGNELAGLLVARSIIDHNFSSSTAETVAAIEQSLWDEFGVTYSAHSLPAITR